ncbi:MAG TPA: UPF0164 family protein, partial [Acidobacteriota bacterium]|nr:UPF0164 family protein [Acidobacteriota bacterium]
MVSPRRRYGSWTRARGLVRCAGVGAVIVGLGSALSLQTASAQSADSKPTGFKVLTIGGGARAVGLAETIVSGVDDPFVLEYNPAGLTAVERFTVSFAHNSYFLDTHGEYLALAVPIGRWAVAARAAYVGSSEFPRRDTPTENPLYLYDASDGIFQGAIAGPVDERLSVGISAAWVVEHIDVETAQSVVLGFGALYRLRHDIQIGASFVNVGPPAKFIDQEFKMPAQLRLGGHWFTGALTARAELVAGEDDNVKWHLGGEYR